MLAQFRNLAKCVTFCGALKLNLKTSGVASDQLPMVFALGIWRRRQASPHVSRSRGARPHRSRFGAPPVATIEHHRSMEALPHIDEHVVETHGPRDAMWTSLLRTLRRTMGGSATFATFRK